MRLRAHQWTAALGLALWGCSQPSSQTTSPEPNRASTATDAAPASPPASTKNPQPCGPGGEAFTDYGWIPADARMLIAVRPDGPELSTALGHTRRYAREQGAKLPVHAKFALSQLDWEVPNVMRMLGEAGFHPGELVRISGPIRREGSRIEVDGTSAWVFRSECDLDRIKPRVREAWDLKLRTATDAVVGEPATGATFPFALLLLPQDRVALVPAPGLDRARRWLTRAGPTKPLAGESAPRAPSEVLADLSPAPVRVVLGAGPGIGVPAQNGPTTLRVTSDGVQNGGRVGTPP